MEVKTLDNESNRAAPRPNRAVFGFWLVAVALLFVILQEAGRGLYENYTRSTSYYSHGFMVPFVSAFFIWRDRKRLSEMPKTPSIWGYAFLLLACFMVLGGDLLGFRIFGQAAIIPLLIGLILIFLGKRHLVHMWFPLVFLLFMIPLPESLTTSMTFRVKMLATEGAVWLANAVYLPMIRDGSYIHFNGDRLLVGDVCGGLRSLIALLALGAIMSYISQAGTWARVLILLVSVPIAVLSNILRIFLLCVVGYFWGSGIASGWVHDLSGVLIYLVALVLMLGLEGLLRRRPSVGPDAKEVKP